MVTNLFDSIPQNMEEELFSSLLEHNAVKIERIVSKGHTSPESGWYDQDMHEWVLIIQGEGHLEFEDGRIEKLKAGDHLNIPAREKHKVCWTDPNQNTIWLAVFYQD